MRKKIILVLFLLSIGTVTVYALKNNFNFDTSKLSFTTNSKKSSVVSNFNQDYNLTYTIKNEDSDFEEEIKTLTKKTTYLLLGDFNNTNESSENFYKRKNDFYDLRYNTDGMSEDEKQSLGLEPNGKEAIASSIASMAIPQIFTKVFDFGLIYSSYGDIRVTKENNTVISSIVLTNARYKEQSKNDPMKYDYVETNYVFYYYYLQLNGEWKLYYLYGESTDDVNAYFGEIETQESGTMAIAPSYQSSLSTVYSFEKLNKMTQEELDNVYNQNVKNIVYFNAYYNNYIVGSANGFFISDGLVVTTWNFLEKALINAQYITMSSNNKVYEIEGIVTANPETNVAVIKVKDTGNSYAKLGDYKTMESEDPAIVISSKLGTGSIVQTGIILSKDGYIQTSIPLSNTDEGSPLINQKGEVIGINTADSVKSSISVAVNSEVLEEIQNKFKDMQHDKIEVIIFDELKANYYYVKYNEENVKNSVPSRKWKKYSKIGNLSEKIKLELVKASYKNGIVSLRYKNGIANYISSMQLAADFKEQLVKDGYEEILNTTSKSIYNNKDYQVIIMDEFDYLIIVLVKL